MPDQEKPYRLYRGGRAKGRVPLDRHRQQRAPRKSRPAPRPDQTPARRIPWRRIVALSLVGLLVLFAAWLGFSWLAFSRGIDEANARLPESIAAVLTEQDGLLTSTPTTILVLGTDGGSSSGRGDARRSDSMMLIHTEPGRKRVSYLSIPRDLRVDIPGYGTAKINAAMQAGGAPLAVRTVKQLTGLDVNHVLIVDFDAFKDVIDAIGGIDVTVRRPILSNAFDCPYSKEKCADWDGWRFARGTQRMDGRRALVYSRIRENRLDPGETDFTRGRRQQQVVEATADRITSLRTALKLPFIGDDLVSPLTTDLSAWELVQLGWTSFRANDERALHCRLGGEPATVDGESVILGSEDNVATIAMFTGRSAPLPPPKGLPYAPGCVVGG